MEHVAGNNGAIEREMCINFAQLYFISVTERVKINELNTSIAQQDPCTYVLRFERSYLKMWRILTPRS